MKESEWTELANYLKGESAQICADNQCTENEHHCDSNAYITEHGQLIDICAADYFRGWGSADVEDSGEYAVIPLPWTGTGAELRDDVETNLPWE